MSSQLLSPKRRAEQLAPFIPYLAVAFGLYGACSAWAALGLYHAGILVVLFLRPRGKPVREQHQMRSGWFYASPAVFALGGVGLYLLWPYLGSDSSMLADRLGVFGINRHIWPYMAVYFCAVNSAIEEIFWRGYLGSDRRVVTLNDFLFGGYHAFVLLAFANPIWAVPVIAGCAFAGWLWRMLRSATGDLTVPIATHLIADISIVVAVHLRAFS